MKSIRSLMLLACVLILLIAGCTTQRPSDGESVLPEQTEVAPFDPTIPHLCDPQQPDLSKLESIEPINPEYGDGIVSYLAKYTNANGQTFQLTASSSPDPQSPENDYARIFLQSLRVCFEAYDLGQPWVDETDDVNLQDDADIRRANLRGEKEVWSVDLAMDWDPQPKEMETKTQWVIHFYIDPTINGSGIDNFQAKCALSAKVRPDLTGKNLNPASASVTATLYRTGLPLGDSTASQSDLAPRPVSDNLGRKVTYDARVRGTPGQSYNIYGSWTKNNSGIQGFLAGCR